MKVKNWRRKLASALVAGGLFVPIGAPAADLDTNLITDPGFENVDPNDAGPFTALRLLDWPDASGDNDDNFAYPYSSGYSGSPAPANSGAYHFSGGFGTAAGDELLSQLIDVSGGATGAEIAAGTAAFSLSGFFSSYLQQDDASSVRARFLDAGDVELALAEIGGQGFLATIPVTGNQVDWAQDSASGRVPVGTARVLVSILSSDADTNHDGYVDNVHFSIGRIPEPGSVILIGIAAGFGAALVLRNGRLP